MKGKIKKLNTIEELKGTSKGRCIEALEDSVKGKEAVYEGEAHGRVKGEPKYTQGRKCCLEKHENLN